MNRSPASRAKKARRLPSPGGSQGEVQGICETRMRHGHRRVHVIVRGAGRDVTTRQANLICSQVALRPRGGHDAKAAGQGQAARGSATGPCLAVAERHVQKARSRPDGGRARNNVSGRVAGMFEHSFHSRNIPGARASCRTLVSFHLPHPSGNPDRRAGGRVDLGRDMRGMPMSSPWNISMRPPWGQPRSRR